jgi:hypothetical protein
LVLLPIPGRTPAQTNVVAAMVTVVIINMSNRRLKTEFFPHFRSSADLDMVPPIIGPVGRMHLGLCATLRAGDAKSRKAMLQKFECSFNCVCMPEASRIQLANDSWKQR